MWRRLFVDSTPQWRLVAEVVVPIALVALLAARTVRRAGTAAMRHLLGDTIATSSPLIRAPLRLISLATFGLVFAVLIFPAFEVVGLKPRAGVHLRTLTSWTCESGLQILLLAAVAFAVI